MLIDAARVLPYVTGMRHKSTLLFVALSLYVTAAATHVLYEGVNVEYQGFCTLETAASAQKTRGCSIRMQLGPAPAYGKVYSVQFDGAKAPTVIRVSGSSCTAGGVPCVEQPSPFPGNLQFTDRAGSIINIPVPPFE
jgi:hypothetical protein